MGLRVGYRKRLQRPLDLDAASPADLAFRLAAEGGHLEAGESFTHQKP